MTKIKLCGMRRECDIEYVNELLPDYIGYIFAPKSKRFISDKEAERLTHLLDNRIVPVGVFVNESVEHIVSLVEHGIIRAVQLHGKEDNDYIKILRKEVDCPIIQAFRIEKEDDIKDAERSAADYILLDSGGGTGEVFDWSLLKGINREFFLAGGLTPENMEQALRMLAKYGVDASSSLETDGYKDKDKMSLFVNTIRSCKC